MTNSKAAPTPIGEADNLPPDWQDYARRVARALSELRARQFLVISDPDDNYVQFACGGPEGT